MGGNEIFEYNKHNRVCTENSIHSYLTVRCRYKIMVNSLLVYICFQYMKDLFLIMYQPCNKLKFVQYLLNCVCVMLVCGDHGCSFLRCPHCYHCLLDGTVGCHRDCIRSCYSCIILAELQAETEGYANC